MRALPVFLCRLVATVFVLITIPGATGHAWEGFGDQESSRNHVATKQIASPHSSCRQCTRRSEVKVAMISHGNWFSESFWISARRGVERATMLFNVSAVLLNPDVFDLAAIAQLVIKSADNYSLIASTVVDRDTVGSAVRAVVAREKTVVSFNSGDNAVEDTQVMHHIGQPEYVAGYRVGVSLARSEKRSVLCIQHETGNAALVARCDGVRDGLRAMQASARLDMVPMDGSSVSALTAGISGYLTANPSTDAIVALNTDVAHCAVHEVHARSAQSTIMIAGFDLNEQVLEFIYQGKMAFTVDQQEFFQTFGSIQMLKTIHMTQGMRVLGRLVLSGPSLVTAATVERKLCQQNLNRVGCSNLFVSPSSLTIGIVSTTSWSSPEAFTLQAKFGVQAAAREFGVRTRLVDTTIFDLAGLSSQVLAAIASGEINALVLPLPSTAVQHNFTSLVQAAVAANITVISWASGNVLGSPLVSSGHIKFHIGSNETASGFQLGQRLNAIIPSQSQVLCLTQELGNEDMPLKCAGVAASLFDGRTVITHTGTGLVRPISSRNTLQAIASIQSVIANNPRVSAIVYPTVEAARVVLSAISQSNLPPSRTIRVVGYGISSELADFILQGRVDFTIDEQPFLQTYLATSAAAFFLTDGYILQNGLLETGPLFLDRDSLPAALCRTDASRDPSAQCPPCPSLCEVNGLCLDSGECQCKAGWVLGKEKNCQVRDPGLRVIEWNSELSITLLTICSLGAILSVVIAWTIIKFKTNPHIKSASWTVSSAMQLGFLLIYIGPLLYVGRPTVSTCAMRPLTLAMGFSIVIGLLLSKTLRLYRLFHSATVQSAKRMRYSDKAVVTHSLVVVAVNLILWAIWIGLDPPRPQEMNISEGRTNLVCIGGQIEKAVSAILVALNVALIVVGAALGFLTRHITAKFNESRSIGLVMYNLTALASIGLPLLYATGTDLNLTFTILGVLCIIGSASTQAIMFGPKLYDVWTKSTLAEAGRSSATNSRSTNLVSLASWKEKRPRKKTLSTRGANATIFQEARTITRRPWETLAARVPARVVRGRLDSITSMWHMAAVFVLRDSQTFLVVVLNLDRPAEPGVVLDMAFTSSRVTEQDKSNGDFMTLQTVNSTTIGAAKSKSQPTLPPLTSPSLSAQSMNELQASDSELDIGFTSGAGIICVASTCGAKVYIQLQDRAQLRHWRQIIEVASGSAQTESGNNASNRKRAESQPGSVCNRRRAESTSAPTANLSPAFVISPPTTQVGVSSGTKAANGESAGGCPNGQTKSDSDRDPSTVISDHTSP